MKKLEISKILVLMVLSVGLIACGSVQQGLNDQGLSEEELALKRAEGGNQAPVGEGGNQAPVAKDEGGNQSKAKIPGKEGGNQAPVVRDEGGNQLKPSDEGGNQLQADLTDNILLVKGVAEKGVTSIGFIFNGKEQFTSAVNKKDQSYMIKIELSDQDLKQLILDVVNGPKVDTIMITDSSVNVYSFKK